MARVFGCVDMSVGCANIAAPLGWQSRSRMGTHVFKIARSGGGIGQAYSVALEERMTVLDALFLIQRKQDPTLSFRCSCRVGMCGTCAMSINWQPRLACQTRVATLESETVHVGPLPHLPVIKDLVV